MSYKVDNAIILTAGLASRFAPISYEKHKALIRVKGEILIERQIRQLHEAGIEKIYIVVGYRKEEFKYLEEKFGVNIIMNDEYLERNNHSSIYAAKDYIRNSYICSADNYFSENPFTGEEEDAYYSAVYSDGNTDEWCMKVDDKDYIKEVTIGGADQWYMIGHVFWSQDFSEKFLEILNDEYNSEGIKSKLWENIYLEHIQELKLKMKRYPQNYIYEFDSLDDLREFDNTYINNSASSIMQQIALELEVDEGKIKNCTPYKDAIGNMVGFTFECNMDKYIYLYKEKKFNIKIDNDRKDI